MESGSQPPKPRQGFLRRHRASLLTAGIALYTLALAVAIADDAFHLGLFPTALEREARGHIQRFGDADEVARREAAEKLIRDVDAFVAVPELIRALDADSPRTRGLAAECLRRITKADVPYDPAAPSDGIARWRQWWREHCDRF